MSSVSSCPRPRVLPGTAREIGPLNALIAHGIGAVMGTGPPHVFTTLGRHRRLFRRWLRFASALMPGGALPRRDTELVILRVAHRCGSTYEWDHHARLARLAGLSGEQIERIARDRPTNGWTSRQAALLAAVDELHERHDISDELWDILAAELTERELIELPMLAGHYEMLAMTLNALRVQPDRPLDPPSPTGRAVATVGRLLRRRSSR